MTEETLARHYRVYLVLLAVVALGGVYVLCSDTTPSVAPVSSLWLNTASEGSP